MADIGEVTRLLENYAAKFDALALRQEKAVKEQKEQRKIAAMKERVDEYNEHISALQANISTITLVLGQDEKPDFISVMKNQRTLSSLYNKLDTELARAKIAATTVYIIISKRLDNFTQEAKGFEFLFKDLQQIIYKDDDDFALVLTSRIKDYKDQERLKEERLRLENEEKIQREIEAKVSEEKRLLAEKIRAEEYEKQRMIDAEKFAKEQADEEKSYPALAEVKTNPFEALVNALVESGLLSTKLFSTAIDKLNAESPDKMQGYRIQALLCRTQAEIITLLNDMPSSAKKELKPLLQDTQQRLKQAA